MVDPLELAAVGTPDVVFFDVAALEGFVDGATGELWFAKGELESVTRCFFAILQVAIGGGVACLFAVILELV